MELGLLFLDLPTPAGDNTEAQIAGYSKQEFLVGAEDSAAKTEWSAIDKHLNAVLQKETEEILDRAHRMASDPSQGGSLLGWLKSSRHFRCVGKLGIHKVTWIVDGSSHDGSRLLTHS